MLLALMAGLFFGSLLVAWLVCTVAMTERGQRKGGYMAVLVGLFLVLFVVGSGAVLPPYFAGESADKLEQAVAEHPAFTSLKKHDPTAFASLVNPLKRAVREGKSHQQVAELALPAISALVATRVSQSSDAAALQMMSALANLVTQVQQKDLKACYDMLHPTATSQAAWTKHVQPEQLTALYAAMGEVIRTSTVDPQPIPYENDVKASLEPVVAELIRLYGKDVLMLLGPPGASTATADKERLCQMEAAFIRLATRLPPTQAGRLVRYLRSKA